MEEHLYAGDHDDPNGEMYPAVLVIATSALGITVSRCMLRAGCIGRLGTWLLEAIFAAKLAMLVLPQVCSLKSCFLTLTNLQLFRPLCIQIVLGCTRAIPFVFPALHMHMRELYFANAKMASRLH